MRTTEDLRQFYNNELKSNLMDLENQRKAILKTALLRGIIGLFCSLIFLSFFGLSTIADNFLIVVFAIFFVFIIVMISVSKPYRLYKGQFKNQIIKPIVGFIDPGLGYNPTGYIEQKSFTACGIFQHKIDRYSGDDLVSGELDKTKIQFSEIHAEYKTETRDSKGRKQTQWNTIFKGLLFIADFNKHFSGKTFVLTDNAENILGRIGNTLQNMVKSHGQLVKLENPEFEKFFAVYADDGTEARYILTPGLMERMVNFRKKSGKKVQFSFISPFVFVAIPFVKDLFEPTLLKKVDNFEMIQEYFQDMELAIGIVEEMNLNNRIWTKK